MSVVNALKTALYTRLSGDSTLTTLVGGTAVFDSQAPEGQAAPYVVFQRLASTPDYTMGGVAYDNTLMMVKGITTGGSNVTGGSIAERIDALLQDAPLTISGATNLYLRRASDIDYPETDRGVVYHHLGAVYRVWTQ